MTHLTFAIAWFFSLHDLNKKVPFYIFTAWILFLFLALRYNYGADYGAYLLKHKYEYTNIKLEGFWEQKEFLYAYLNVLIRNFQLLIAVISLFYMLTINRMIKKNLDVKYYSLAWLILLINPYLFLVHLSSLRQTIAICFVVIAVGFAIKKKFLMYIVFVLIATGFHQSALILLPVYFFLNRKKISKFSFFMIYGLLITLLFTPLLDYLMFESLKYFPRYERYVSMGIQNNLRSTILTGFFFLLVSLNINKLEGKEIVFGKLALISTFISMLAVKMNMIGRIAMYFDVFIIIAIPLIIARLKLKLSKQLVILFVVGIYLMRYVSFFNNNVGYDAYRTILSM